jgi:hypothetical protein
MPLFIQFVDMPISGLWKEEKMYSSKRTHDD